MTNDEDIRFTLRTPKTTIIELDKLSKKIGISKNALIVKILYDYVNKEENK